MDDSGHEVYFNPESSKVLGWADGTAGDPAGLAYGRVGRQLRWPRLRDGRRRLGADARGEDGRREPGALRRSVVFSVGRLRVDGKLGPCLRQRVVADLRGVGRHRRLPVGSRSMRVATSPTCTDALSSKAPPRWWEARDQVVGRRFALGGDDGGVVSLPRFPVTRTAQISPTATYDAGLNYSRQQFDEVLDAHGGKGLQVSTHVNGDVGIDLVLDAYERSLSKNGLIGSDHRWRIEHLGGARADQLERAAALGVSTSLGLFQFIFWGDLTDGQIFPPEIGSQWIRVGDAVRAGAVVSFHNDAPVTPPNVAQPPDSRHRRTPLGPNTARSK